MAIFRKIVFMTSSHSPYDERIFYHFADSLKDSPWQVSVICSTENIDTIVNGVIIKGFHQEYLSKKEKILKFIEYLKKAQPDVTVCSEPLTVLAAHRYRKSVSKKTTVIYDITEWYPSKTYLENIGLLKKIFTVPFHFI